ncbi:MAG: hypothetical protein ABSG53_20710 [Thermoguttaceae bacterium]|jgi:hypothetical protein
MMDFELSPLGQARHDRILELALHQARRQRRRRLAVRAGIIFFALVGIGMALLHVLRSPLDPPRASTANESIAHVLSPAERPGARKVIIERIETDPTIARRLAVPSAAPKWEQIDDDQLSQELAKAGRPAGLAKIGGHVTLIFHDHSS